MGDSELQSDVSSSTLKVSEIFYSLQGEGARAGEPSVFIRLSGCSAKHACYRSGVVCDTEFESGFETTLVNLHENVLIRQFATLHPEVAIKNIVPQILEQRCKWIVWTGGEPLDQLTIQILQFFKDAGYKQAIETSGARSMPEEMTDYLDHIAVSPKVAEHILAKHFDFDLRGIGGRITTGPKFAVDELRYVRHAGQLGIPQPALFAKHYYLSPHSDGAEINRENLEHCIRLCLENPQWRLSVQLHKLWKVL